MRITALLLAQVALSVASQFAPSSLYFDPEALDRVLLVRIPCGDCPGSDVQEIDLGLEFVIPSSLTELAINGQPVLPLHVAGISTTPLSAIMIPREADLVDYMQNAANYPNLGLDYQLMISESISKADMEHKKDSLELRVYGVDGTPVKIDALTVAITENLQTGAMTIDSAYRSPAKPACKTASCLLGSLFEKMAAPVKNLRRPCHGKGRKGSYSDAIAQGFKDHGEDRPRHGGHPLPPHHHHDGPHHDGAPHDWPHHGHGPHHGGPRPGHHGHHGHRHSGLFSRMVNQILLPVLVGIAAGVAISALGLLIGHIFTKLIRKVRGQRRIKCRHSRKHVKDVESGDKEASMGLLAEKEVEAPPAYKDDGTVVEAVEKE